MKSWISSIAFLRAMRGVAVLGFMLSFYLIVDTALQMDHPDVIEGGILGCKELGLKLVLRIVLIQFHASILLWAVDEVIHVKTQKVG